MGTGHTLHARQRLLDTGHAAGAVHALDVHQHMIAAAFRVSRMSFNVCHDYLSHH